MTVPTQPLSEITREAIAVLVRELGVARTLRFLGQYRTGQGDYTAERHGFLTDPPLEELFDEAQRLDQEQSG
ncbi:MAG: hypothetical protein ACR2GR_08105 [Rhodothermales bacterium]